MAVYGVGPGGVSTVTPTCRHGYTKIGILEVADGSTGFLAFKLPKYAVVMGVYTICTGEIQGSESYMNLHTGAY